MKKSGDYPILGMRCRFLRVFICLLFSFISTLSFSQKVDATVDRDKILIGQQIELKIIVTDIDKNKAIGISQWVNVPDSFNHIEVVHRSPIDTVSMGGVYSYTQKIILTSFDSGYWQIPALSMLLSNKERIASPTIQISVLPVDVSNLKDYHDVKPIIEVKAETDWQFIVEVVAAILLIMIVVILIVLYFKKRKKKNKSASIHFGIKEALQQIDELQKKGLIEKQEYKMFFSQLIDICRSFSDIQLQISAVHKTSDEYMLVLKGKVGNQPAQIQYFQLLRLADVVKFAKFVPSPNECEEAVNGAKIFLQTIYEYQKINECSAVG